MPPSALRIAPPTQSNVQLNTAHHGSYHVSSFVIQVGRIVLVTNIIIDLRAPLRAARSLWLRLRSISASSTCPLVCTAAIIITYHMLTEQNFGTAFTTTASMMASIPLPPAFVSARVSHTRSASGSLSVCLRSARVFDPNFAPSGSKTCASESTHAPILDISSRTSCIIATDSIPCLGFSNMNGHITWTTQSLSTLPTLCAYVRMLLNFRLNFTRHQLQTYILRGP